MAVDGEVVRMCECPEEHAGLTNHSCLGEADRVCPYCGLALCADCENEDGMCTTCWYRKKYPPDVEPEPVQVVDAEPQTSQEQSDHKAVPYLSEGAEHPTLVIYGDPDAGEEDSDNYSDCFSDCFVTEAFIRAIPEGIDLGIGLYITEDEGGIAWGTTRYVRLDRTQLGKLIEFLTQHQQQLGE